MSTQFYENRTDAGEQLRNRIGQAHLTFHHLVAIPRGGVEVGAPIAHALGCPMSLITPRKIGAPGQEEVAIGAVGPDGSLMLNESLVEYLRVTEEYISLERQRQLDEIARRMSEYPNLIDLSQVPGQRLLLIDDGVATGYTLMAAIKTLHAHKPSFLAVALPVGPSDVLAKLNKLADMVICPHIPEPFYAVGAYYHDFAQTSDQTVRQLLHEINNNI